MPSVAYAETTPTDKGTADKAGDVDCSVSNLGICISNLVYVFTIGIASNIAYVSAYVLNTAAFLALRGDIYGLDFISQMWTTIRDIANMLFILILVYLAFTIMLQADTRGTMQTLVLVIFIALIINFSFFATRLVIDGGNILAVQFYNAIPGQTISGGEAKDLTAVIMDGIDVQNILGGTSFKEWNNSNTGLTGFLNTTITLSLIYICVGVMLFMLAAAFISVGVKLLVRIVVLWFVIIASPLALVAKTMKRFEKYYDKWQTALITHAFYPAVFFVMYLVIASFMGSISGGKFFDQIFSGINPGSQGIERILQVIANVGIRLGFVLVMLYIALKVSEQMSTYGAAAAKNITSWGTHKMSDFAYGVPGFVGRQTLGRASRAAAQSSGVQNLATRNTLFGRTFGRGLQSTLHTVGKGSFDVRGLPGGQALRGALQKNYGLGPVGYELGKGGEGKLEARLSRMVSAIRGSSSQAPGASTTAPQTSAFYMGNPIVPDSAWGEPLTQSTSTPPPPSAAPVSTPPPRPPTPSPANVQLEPPRVRPMEMVNARAESATEKVQKALKEAREEALSINKKTEAREQRTESDLGEIKERVGGVEQGTERIRKEQRASTGAVNEELEAVRETVRSNKEPQPLEPRIFKPGEGVTLKRQSDGSYGVGKLNFTGKSYLKTSEAREPLSKEEMQNARITATNVPSASEPTKTGETEKPASS